MTNDVTKGITTLIQVAGLGGLRHNTILLTWPKEWRKTYKTAQNVILFELTAHQEKIVTSMSCHTVMIILVHLVHQKHLTI